MTEKPPSGGPAFPVSVREGVIDCAMSMRDYFAGQALCGLIAGQHIVACPPEIVEKGHNAIELWRHEQHLLDAEYCYEMADAMLSRR